MFCVLHLLVNEHARPQREAGAAVPGEPPTSTSVRAGIRGDQDLAHILLLLVTPKPGHFAGVTHMTLPCLPQQPSECFLPLTANKTLQTLTVCQDPAMYVRFHDKPRNAEWQFLPWGHRRALAFELTAGGGAADAVRLGSSLEGPPDFHPPPRETDSKRVCDAAAERKLGG